MATKVLVVDDEAGMRETLVDILEGAGYEVAAAPDGNAALASVHDTAFDVVLMDIRMPGPDGVTVLQRMGSPPPRVIMMTAYAVEDQLRRAMDALSPRQKSIFVLKHFEELSIPEIADLTGLDIGTVKSHLFRAAHKIRQRLGEYRTRKD